MQQIQRIYKVEYRFAEGAKTQVTVQAKTRGEAIAIAGEQVRARFKEMMEKSEDEGLILAEVYRAPLEKRWLRIRSGVPMRSAFGAVCCHAWLPLAVLVWQEMASMALVLFGVCLVGWSIWLRAERRKALRPIGREEAGKIYEAMTRARFISGEGKMKLALWDLSERRNWYGEWAWMGGEKELAAILCGEDARYVGGFCAEDFRVKELMKEHLQEVIHALDLYCPKVHVFSASNGSSRRVVIVAPNKVESRCGIACHAWLPLAVLALPEVRWDWVAWLAMGLGLGFAIMLLWVLIDTLRCGSGWSAEEETDLEREAVPALPVAPVVTALPAAPVVTEGHVQTVQAMLFMSWLINKVPITEDVLTKVLSVPESVGREMVERLLARRFELNGVRWKMVQNEGPFGRCLSFEVVKKGGEA